MKNQDSYNNTLSSNDQEYFTYSRIRLYLNVTYKVAK